MRSHHHQRISVADRSVLFLVVPPVVGQEPHLDVPVLVVGLPQELADGLPFRLQRGGKLIQYFPLVVTPDIVTNCLL